MRAALSAVLLAGAAGTTARPLPRGLLRADAELSVSGFSAGASAAVQLAVAHSSRVAGLGVFAGKPYWCERGAGRAAYNGTSREVCRERPRAVDVGALLEYAELSLIHI